MNTIVFLKLPLFLALLYPAFLPLNSSAKPTATSLTDATPLPPSWIIAGKGREQGVELTEDHDTPGMADGQSSPLRLSKKEGSATIYQVATLEENGIYDLEVHYRSEAAPAKGLSIKLAFAKEGGHNGSAGSQHWSLPTSTNTRWQIFRKKVYVPAGAQICQIILSLTSSGKENAWIGGVYFYPEESIGIPLLSQPLALESPADDPQWNQLPFISGFWKLRNPLEETENDTRVQIGYDMEALYLQFINAEPYPDDIRVTTSERDGPVFRDDSNELYLSLEGGDLYQFITSANGTQWDDRLVQKADGDPYRPSHTWSGKWETKAWIEKDRWISRWVIPWSEIGYHPKAGSTLSLNFTRHRQTGAEETSLWNRFDGRLATREKFATLAFSTQGAALTRFSEEIVARPLAIERPQKKYSELLDSTPGDYQIGDWAHGFYLSDYPERFQREYTPEAWKEEQLRQLQAYAKAGMFGPALPWVANHLGWETVQRFHREWNLRFPYFLDNSGLNRLAIADGAQYLDPRFNLVPIFDPIRLKIAIQHLEAFLSRHPDAASLISKFYGIDEPTNSMYGPFSRTIRKDADAILDRVDAEIKATTGFGKYGLYDAHNPAENATADIAFRRIAFNRWWNQQTHTAAGELRAEINRLAPGIPFCSYTHNTVSGVTQGDIALLAQNTDWISTDPYPTATLSIYGRARALYHTGFVTKLMSDLSGGKPLSVIPQGFRYHGRDPDASDAREWASQALKNGAQGLHWYIAGPTSFEIPELSKELMRIHAQVAGMNRLKLPKETRTAILFSPTTQAALNDVTLHSYYTLYTLLGERAGSWFRFISETTLNEKPNALDPYTLIYLPQASYFSREAAEALSKRVKEGATLVILDPDALTHAPDGNRLKEIRDTLIGGDPGAAQPSAALTTLDQAPFQAGWQLPLTPIANLERAREVIAYTITPPSDATIVATYPTGQPAAYRRPIGKGSVIYFAAQPFGNSELAVAASQWEPLLRALAQEHKEPLDLPIWDFYLPASSSGDATAALPD